MNCDLDCQFEDGLDEGIDTENEFDCGIGYEEEEIHSTSDSIIEEDNVLPKYVPGIPEV